MKDAYAGSHVSRHRLTAKDASDSRELVFILSIIVHLHLRSDSPSWYDRDSLSYFYSG